MELNMIFLKWLISITFLALIAGCNSSDNSSTGSGTGGSVSGFSVSGRLIVASNVAADVDTNDLNAPTTVSNNQFAAAQVIPNPVIVGGYVNVSGSGNSGRTRNTGDVSDFYAVNLQRGQLAMLFIADGSRQGIDLDLYLYDNQGKIIDASINEGMNESLFSRQSGAHVIEVRAEAGASNYVLTLSQNVGTSSDIEDRGSRLSDDFAVGELIVQLAESDEADLTVQADVLSALGLQTQHFDRSRRMLFTLDNNTLQTLSTSSVCADFASEALCDKYKTLMQLKQVRQHHAVLAASPNHLLQAYRVPNDPFFEYQWHYKMMNLSQAWDMTLGSPDVIVAVVDTGVLLSHPDLRGKLVAGYDFISDPAIAKDGDGIDSNPNDPGGKEGREASSNFHGTHVAGTIAAATNNGVGVAGVGWLTRVMPLRVLGRGGSGREYDTEQAIRFAAGLPNDSRTVPTQRADIINLSLGGSRISAGFTDAINQARARGVIVVAASGNDGSSAPTYPAALDGVISVSAVALNKELAYYSNYGSTIDVAAPGGDKSTPDLDGDGRPDQIASTFGDDSSVPIQYTYYYQQGTSMAAPHVSGVIALMKAVNPDLTPGDVDSLLRSGQITDDIGRTGRDDQFGYGLINARKAVAAASELLSGPPRVELLPSLVVNPNSLNFGASTQNNTLTVSNGGGGLLSVTEITADGGNVITVRPLSVDGNGLGSYQVSLNRGNLAPGTYSATVVFRSTVNTVRVPLILQVAAQNQSTTGDAGYHYILLVQPDTLETVKEIQANVRNGTYSFDFTNVPVGRYQIIAGTDANNDGYICDSGEACGSYLSLDQPSTIEVGRNMTLADFATTFNVNFLTGRSADEMGFRGYPRLSTESKRVQP
jgi:serine protease